MSTDTPSPEPTDYRSMSDAELNADLDGDMGADDGDDTTTDSTAPEAPPAAEPTATKTAEEAKPKTDDTVPLATLLEERRQRQAAQAEIARRDRAVADHTAAAQAAQQRAADEQRIRDLATLDPDSAVTEAANQSQATVDRLSAVHQQQLTYQRTLLSAQAEMRHDPAGYTADYQAVVEVFGEGEALRLASQRENPAGWVREMATRLRPPARATEAAVTEGAKAKLAALLVPMNTPTPKTRTSVGTASAIAPATPATKSAREMSDAELDAAERAWEARH